MRAGKKMFRKLKPDGCMKKQNMSKRNRSVLLFITALLLMAVLLCGCAAAGGTGGSKTEGNKAEGNKTEGSSSSQSEGETVDHIVMTYHTSENHTLTDIDQVVEAINVIAREKAGVEIELLPVDSIESASTYPMWLTQGKRIDLMILTFQDISRYVEQSMLLPLGDLLEKEGREILALEDESQDLTSAGKVQGEVYGLTLPSAGGGSCGGLWIPARYLEEIDFDYDKDHIYSRAELDELFAAMKANHPDRYPLGAVAHPYDFSISTFFINGFNALFSDNYTGVLEIDKRDHKIVNYYETQTYRDWLYWMRSCYEKGYIHPDAATLASSMDSLVKDNITMSISLAGSPFLLTNEAIGEPIRCLRLTDIVQLPSGSRSTFWTIPATAANPDAAMRFLNLMYTDEDVINLFAWGIEGKHYILTEPGVVDYPEGLAAETVSYRNTFGLYGDQRKVYDFQTKEKKLAQEEFAALSRKEGLDYIGFTFDESSVSVEINQVKQVLDRYLDPLETGSVDTDQVYPQFIRELYDAGLQTILDEKQRQFDIFLGK